MANNVLGGSKSPETASNSASRKTFSRSILPGKLLGSIMALSAIAATACASDELVTMGASSEDSGATGKSGLALSGDATSTVDAADDVTATDGGVDMADDASTATADAAFDADDSADGNAEVTNDTTTTDAAETTIDATVGTTDGTTADNMTVADTLVVDTFVATTDVPAATVDVGTSNAIDTSSAAQDTATKVPSTPKEICEALVKQYLATLKPGQPECTGSIPGVGKVAGTLACQGDNLEPNCVIN